MSEIKSDYPAPFSPRFLTPRFWPTWLILGLLWLLGQLPHHFRKRLGYALGDLALRRHHKRRAIVLTNLQWCFPELSANKREALAKNYFRTLAMTLLDYSLVLWGRPKQLQKMLTMEGAEHLQAQVAADKPVILLTAHNVALDFGATLLTQRFASVGLVKQARNPLMDWVMAKGRCRFHGILFTREQGMRPVIKAVRAGHAFYYLPDEDLGTENSVFVPFFGVPTATITALSRLARINKAVVLPYTTYYRPEDGRYVAHIFPAMENFPGENETENATRMNQELEKIIRLAPEQYMWSMRIFQTRPDASPPPYVMNGNPDSGHYDRPKS
ncbi:MAG: lysophospholipid acyltransferase family protein [Gammaproteobacteria bacterium]|nr:lysophospholipid acyltransferase family protein [Gammaproteobacteria bacterium]